MKAATATNDGDKIRDAISIHAAREGGDAAFGQHVVCNRVFQSTPPVKAATETVTALKAEREHFNPRRP